MTRWMRIVPWLLVAGYLACIFYLSSQPNPLPALTARVSDKLLHAVEYGALGALLAWALRARGVPARRAVALAWLAAAAYGASDEFHQWFVPGRSAEAADWAADAAGAALGAIAAVRALRRRAGSAHDEPSPGGS